MTHPSFRRFAACCCGALVAAHAGFAQSPERPRGSVVVSNMNDNTVMVLDAGTGSMLATLPTGEGPHEVAISRDGRWAVVSNYGVRGRPGSSLTVVDIAALSVARTIDLQGHERPHGMAFLSGDTILLVTSEAEKAVLLVDFRTGAVLRERPTNGRTSHMVASPASGDVIVTANISDGTISRLAPLGHDSATVIPVAAQPEGIAISPDGRFAWAGSNRDSVVVVVDVRAARVIDTLRGFGLPYRMAISPDGRLAVVTDPAKAEVRIFDAATHAQRFIVAISRDSLVATAEIPGSPSPEGVAISADSRWAFVTLQGRNRMATIDLRAGRLVAMAPIGTWADGIGFSPRDHPR